MKKIKILLLFLTAFGANSFASHIIGGEVYYDSLGNDQYRVVFEIYRDCSGSDFDDPFGYTVFNANGSVFLMPSVALPTPDTIPVVYDDPCVTPPSDVCVERAVYIDTITLPASPLGYYITYQRCCWAGNIQNILDPASWGITITTTVPGTDLVQNFDNNCARFNEYPPIVLCSNNTLDFDHSAYDEDGDSLAYSICTPKTIDVSAGVANFNELPEPYSDLQWEAGFSNALPLGAGSNVTIDPQTGMMSITPNLQGTFVMAVCVEEWRNGVLINMKNRTFGYRVVLCDVETPMQVDIIGDAILIEDCGSAGFIVTRDDTTESVVLEVIVSGTATNGTDYNYLADSLVLPIGVFTDTITITPFLDGIIEGNESVEFSIIVENICEGTFDTTSAIITIQDYINMSITSEDSINVCDDIGETGMVWCSVTNGVPNYNYYWEPLSYVNNDTLTFPATDLNENLNTMFVTVTDACGKTILSDPIEVYNQCKLVVPNVITANGDGANDYFVIDNRSNYDKVSLTVTNRWGNVVYESTDYKDDWSGLDKGGQPLTEGVYYYLVTPESLKYEYDDQEKTLYTLHGFFYIVK